ncbi:hypothetical protein [Saccharopolyspora sp. NPDC002376]
MADVFVVTTALSELLKRGNGCEAVTAVRGEMFFHFAVVLELLADWLTDLGGDEVLRERVMRHAQRYREQGRAILGGVA